MSNQGDDCYFYFYSTCTKGDSCAFRHCEAALGSETICSLWQEGRCFRQVCKFRHMEINKKRSEIPCYWENQLSGCQKINCAFRHVKGRYVEGLYLPPSKTPEVCEADPQPSQGAQAPVAPTPQIRGVMKIEANENVPSPTHPPVVINAADDDEDDDDQFSEEGDDLKSSGQQHLSPGGHQGARLISTRKSTTPRKVGNLNFGIQTLKEIKLKKNKDQDVAEKVSIGSTNVLDAAQNAVVSEKNKNIVRTVMFSKNELSRHLNLAQRLGNPKVSPLNSLLAVSAARVNFPVKKTLSERLGKMITPPAVSSDTQSKKVKVPRLLKDRLGLPAEQNSTETERAANPSADFRIKTLQEIRQEKAIQRHGQEATSLSAKKEDGFSVKSTPTVKSQSEIRIKSLSEIQIEKRLKRLQDGVQKSENKVDEVDCKADINPQNESQVDTAQRTENSIGTKRKQGDQANFDWKIRTEIGIKQNIVSDTEASSDDAKKAFSVSLKKTRASSQSIEQVRVKTLEEIRQEKALRLQQAKKTESAEPVPQVLFPPTHKKILRLSKVPVTTEPKQPTLPAKNYSEKMDSKTSLAFTTTSGSVNSDKQDTARIVTIDSVNKPGVIESQEKPQHKNGTSVESSKPSVEIFEKTAEGKPQMNVELCVTKNRLTVKRAMKRKEQENTLVAEVKPMNPAGASTETFLLPAAESVHLEKTLITAPPAKQFKESSPLLTPEPSGPTTSQTSLKSRRTSIASVGNSLVPPEDDFDSMIWDISEGKLEAEIDLDQDEDALLLELSEMIDS